MRLSGGARLQTDGVVTMLNTLTLLLGSLPGWEVEARALIPGLDRRMDVNLTAGYAGYKSSTFAAISYDISRSGIKARPLPVLGATYFGNERIVGNPWMFSIGRELSGSMMGGRNFRILVCDISALYLDGRMNSIQFLRCC
jgi:hypothetical protein